MGSTATKRVDADLRSYGRGLLRYDSRRKRVWLGSQRLHHGLTGVLMAGAGIAGLAAHRLTPRGGLEWALFGSALMAHDWHDRARWFEPGPQDD